MALDILVVDDEPDIRDLISGVLEDEGYSTRVAADSDAALAAVNGPLDSVYAMREAFDRRRLTMHRMLNEIDGVTCIEPEGAFYAFPNMQGLLNRDLGGKTAATTLELAGLILDDAQVAMVPGEAFGLAGYARFSFALADADLEEGLKRIQDLV